MSRVIVKNLPSKCTEDQIRRHFKEYEPITDVSLKYTKEGVFRKFAFVGFSTDLKAKDVIQGFNQTFFGTNRIVVEECAAIDEKNKVRPWSKYSKGSSAFKRIHGDDSVLEASGSKKKRTENPLASKYGHDSLFNEFLKVRGVEMEGEKEEDKEDSTEILLKAIEDFKGDKALSLIFRGLPANLKQTNLKEWLSPIRIKSCFQARASSESFALVTFNRPADLRKALQRTDQFLGGYKVKICKFPEEKKEKQEAEEAEDFNFEEEQKKVTEKILETGRLFLRNLPYVCTESDITFLFKKFGEIVDVQCVVNRETGQCKGFAVVTFMFPENALTAYTELDGTVFKGRMLHILPGDEKPESSEDKDNQEGFSKFQKDKFSEKKSKAGKSYSWNTLFLGANAVADTLAEKLNMDKAAFLEGDNVNSAAVRMSLAETRLVKETRAFLEEHGVQLDAFSRPATTRSTTCMIVKNLPASADSDELQRMFERFGELKRFLLPPECKVTALVEMKIPADAKIAFTSLAYSKYKSQPLYLEWAPVDVFKGSETSEETVAEQSKEEPKLTKKEKRAKQLKEKYGHGDDEEEAMDTEEVEVKQEQVKEEDTDNVDESNGRILFVKNLNFDTTEETLQEFFAKKHKVESVTISKKAEKTKNGAPLNMGFGFVTFKSVDHAEKALRSLQGALLDGHAIELKRSRKQDLSAQSDAHKRTVIEHVDQGESTKIMVRNIPFQATEKEVRALFSAFGELKTVRLPKKVGCRSQHRGFAFIDFTSKIDAKTAFDSLVHSTHLYGRRLVLEWAKEEESLDDLRTKTIKKYSATDKSGKMTRNKIRSVVQDGMEAASRE